MGKQIDIASGVEMVEETPMVEPTVNTEVIDEEPFKDFLFGDLYIKCSCGHEEKFIPGIEGIRVELPATNKHNLKIVCSKCKHELSLFYKEAGNIAELIAKKTAALAEEQKENINETTTEVVEGNKEDGSGIVE